jgi:hypothetical protein
MPPYLEKLKETYRKVNPSELLARGFYVNNVPEAAQTELATPFIFPKATILDHQRYSHDAHPFINILVTVYYRLKSPTFSDNLIQKSSRLDGSPLFQTDQIAQSKRFIKRAVILKDGDLSTVIVTIYPQDSQEVLIRLLDQILQSIKF